MYHNHMQSHMMTAKQAKSVHRKDITKVKASGGHKTFIGRAKAKGGEKSIKDT